MTSQRARDKLARAEANLGRVNEHTPDSFEAFQELGIVKDGIYKNLEDGIQNLLDVCALLVKTQDLGVPDEESGFTDLLLEAGILDREEKELLDDLRGLRNRLVHRYGAIDDRIVHDRILEGFAEIERLIASLRALVEDR